MVASARAAPRSERRCTLLVAAAGYGKTTVLESDAARDGVLYLTADQALSRLSGDGRPGRRATDGREQLGAVVVDEVERLDQAEQSALLDTLRDLPDRVPLVLASRHPVPALARSLPGRTVLDRGAVDLALGGEGTARVLREEHGILDAAQAHAVHTLTAGWPALVHLAGDAVTRHEAVDVRAALTEPGSAAASWLHDQVLDELPRAAAQLLSAAIALGPVTGQLCEDLYGPLGLTGADEAHDAFAWLTRTGLLVTRSVAGVTPGADGYRPVPVLGALVEDRRGSDEPADRRTLWSAAAAWYEANGEPLAAATMFERAGDPAAAMSLVQSQSAEMLGSGGAVEVARLVEARPPAERTELLQLVLGDARRMSGDASGANRALQPLVDAARSAGAWPAGLAWRRAMVSYMTGDFRTALDVCDAAVVTPVENSDAGDVVRLHSCRAAALFMLGDTEGSGTSAAQALAAADDAGDPRSAASAHVAAAMSATGPTREDHLRRAQAGAESAGDIAQLARVLVNQGDDLLEQARYAKALAVGRRALRAAEQGSPPGLLTIALNNLGEALLWSGQYDDAALYFERSVTLSREAGLNRAASGVTGLAEIARARGRPQHSRIGFEEAVQLARDLEETQVLVPALAGLARVLAEGHDPELATAAAVAEEAVAAASADLMPQALVARGWVALAAGDVAKAQADANQAISAARTNRSSPALATALELAAAATADADEARTSLREVLALWEDAGAAPAADRARVLLGRLPGADSVDRLAAREAGRRLVEAGVQVVDGEPVLPADAVRTALQVRVLGRFEVRVAGRPVPLTAWRSRQARTLMKMLVARRGRPIPRGEVCEVLWPDDEPARTAHRLSVLLSVVRTVLDPAKAYPADHYLRADLAGVSLDTSHVTVDALDLLHDAAHASQLARDGEEQQARDVFAHVDAMYRGDAFDEEPYEEWADALREETRTAWLRALREDAELSRDAGDLDHAVGNLVRLLAADAYDESAHALLVATLVGAGRHGEARRAFDRWTQAMQSIDAPLPDERVLRGDPAGREPAVDLTTGDRRRVRPGSSA